MKIVTAVVNNPTFIEMQFNSLKKYYVGFENTEFIVFNDAKNFPDFSNGGDSTIKDKIIELCKTLGIKCINVPNEHHRRNQHPCDRHAEALNFIMKYQIENPDKYLLLDSDMFLIDRFDVKRYDGYDCAIVLQSRDDCKINYLWVGLYYFDMSRMKNFSKLDWRLSDGCDTGGSTQFWLKENGGVIPSTDAIRWSGNQFRTTIYYIKHLWSCTWDENELPLSVAKNEKLFEFLQSDPRNVDGKFFCEVYDGCFFHYRAGGNWRTEDGMIRHNTLTRKLNDAMFS